VASTDLSACRILYHSTAHRRSRFVHGRLTRDMPLRDAVRKTRAAAGDPRHSAVAHGPHQCRRRTAVAPP